MATQTEKPKRSGMEIPKESSAETVLVRKASAVREAVTFDVKGNGRSAIAPSYDPLTLLRLTQSNNTLLQCIEAMEVNVDGTGVEIIAVEEDAKIDEAEQQRIQEILDEPYPDLTFTTLRRSLRRALESTGNAYLEVVKGIDGTFIGFRPLEAQFCRLTSLSDSFMSTRTLVRNGVETEFKIPDRERAVVYQRNSKDKPAYYKIWGNSLSVNKEDGEFVEGDLEADKRASEVIVFSMNDDPETPYGVPRWINQLPSVVGSRKAEEQNLDYFDAGGIPSAIIFLNGGQVAESSSETLKNYVSGKKSQKNKAVVVEVMSTGGSLDKAGSVNVQVERFGSEAVNDSLYRNYDKDCEEHVRLAFRLPPMFVGKASDYNYATAVVAYQVAEAQVFKPERDEFDAIMNRVLTTELGLKTCKIKSNPITLRDISTQLRGITLLKDVVSPEEVVKEVSKLTDITLTYEEGKQFPVSTPRSTYAVGEGEGTDDDTKKMQEQLDGQSQITKSAGESANYLIEFARMYAEAKDLMPSNNAYTTEQIEQFELVAKSMKGETKKAFENILSLYLFGQDSLIDSEIIQ